MTNKVSSYGSEKLCTVPTLVTSSGFYLWHGVSY